MGLEDDMGLPNSKYFFTGSFIWRITPRSGIYAHYYGINRSDTYTTDKDFIFLDDTIPSGTSNTVFFNTHITSGGYLLSIFDEPKAFLGAYFNIFFMGIGTGVHSNSSDSDPSIKFTAPLPNFGLVMNFSLTKWLELYGDIGFFTINMDTFSGTIFNLNAGATFIATRWLGFNLSYQEFNVDVSIPNQTVNTTIDYNFRGPSLGLFFVF